MGFSKPTVQLDWINDDSGTKYTIPSGPDQLAGHISDTAADPKIFNWCWWRVSQWVEFLDNTFDSNGNEVNAPKSTTIIETVAPVASTVTLDAGGIKSWDGSSNAIFSVTESGVVTLGYSGNNIINLTAGVLSVATATAADLVKLHAITPSAADINPLLGAAGNGLVAADITKLAAIDASAAEINITDGLITTTGELNQLSTVTVGGTSAGDIVTIDDIQSLTNKTLTSPKINEDVVLVATSTELDQLVGVSVGGNTSGDILTTDDTQTLTNKTIDADNNTISNLEHGSEVDNLTIAHGATGAVVGTTNTQTLTNKRLTSPKINEDVVLTSTSTQIDAAVTSTVDSFLGDSVHDNQKIRSIHVDIFYDYNITWISLTCTLYDQYNALSQTSTLLTVASVPVTSGYWTLTAGTYPNHNLELDVSSLGTLYKIIMQRGFPYASCNVVGNKIVWSDWVSIYGASDTNVSCDIIFTTY